MRKSLTVLTLILAVAAGLRAQSFTSLSGTVIDPTGAVVPGVSVTLENVSTGAVRTVESDAAGRYALLQVPPGTYKVTAKVSGFNDLQVSDVRLLVNSPTTLNLTFEKLQTLAAAVSVSAEATQVNTTDASLGNAVGTQTIVQLPFEARNVVGLLALQPGVTYIGETTDSRNGAVNGGKSDQANVTLDGVDVNEQQNRYAFTSVLRVTLDSVQEFRVTTLGANADQGRSSGAQVALVTKSGTNQIHGSLYEYLRNTATTANSFFSNAAGVDRAKLNRNIFGGAVGGPVRKNRMFYFFNYEGRRDRSARPIVRTVPSLALREGTVLYKTASGVATLTPADIKSRVDPVGIGPNPATLQVMRSYPEPNDRSVGDGLNTLGYRFNAPLQLRWNTYISRLDYALDAAGRHQLFWRGNLQNDNAGGPPQFPGQPPASVDLTNSKGLAVGYNFIIKPNLISVTRYGYTRQGTETTGVQSASATHFRTTMDTPVGLTRGLTQIIPVRNITQDFTWTRGAHSVQFGGVVRLVRNSTRNYSNSFNEAWMDPSNLRGGGSDLNANLPDMDRTFFQSYRRAMSAVLGVISTGRAYYNYDIQGNTLPTGTPVRRTFVAEEYEMYVQDTWRFSRSLTVTGGLRYSLLPPIYEADGLQASPNMSLGAWFDRRGALADAGRSQAEAGKISYLLASGPGGSPFYAFHKKNFAPRLALAFSPQSGDGLVKWLTGGPGRTSIRAGFGMYYDTFGQGLIRNVNATAFGFSTLLQNPTGQLTSSNAPRFTGLYELPSALLLPAPKGGFPATPTNAFAIVNSIEDTIRPPYSMALNFSAGREFKHGIYIQGSYVGRLSRRSLINSDLAMPTNLYDPASGMSYFEAAQAVVRLINASTPIARVPKIPYWENLWPGAAGGGRTATQNVFQAYVNNAPDWSSGLADIDQYCSGNCSRLGANAIFNAQYSSLAAMRSVAGGNYHAMQWTVRKRFTGGTQFDFSYTLSKSIDLGSGAEREGAFNSLVINSWAPWQKKGVSDYDTTQQWTANFVFELPFGRKHKWLNGAGGPLDAIIGGWQLAGLWRQTTELPVSVANGSNFPTNWNIAGFATQVGAVPAPTKSRNAPAIAGSPGPNVFSNPRAALTAYDFTLPGETGQRNGIRVDGYFTVDLSLSKRFRMPFAENHGLQFRWETFNAGNNVRFSGASLNLGNTGTFGKYSGVLTQPRVMQFGLRYEF